MQTLVVLVVMAGINQRRHEKPRLLEAPQHLERASHCGSPGTVSSWLTTLE
jgi:hypothetical protein